MEKFIDVRYQVGKDRVLVITYKVTPAPTSGLLKWEKVYGSERVEKR